MAKKKQQADVKIKKPKEKKSKIKPVKPYSDEYKRAKVNRFITKAKKFQKILMFWAIAVGCGVGYLVQAYGNVDNMPDEAQIIYLCAFFSLAIPITLMKQNTRFCPVCENKVGKFLGWFEKRCPHCHTDLDPENEVVIFK